MRFNGIYILLFVLLFACKKENGYNIQNLNGGEIAIIGHAGSGLSSVNNPEKDNTFASIEKAIELYGANGVELDVHMSWDSVFFLLHDQTLEVCAR